MRHEIVVTTEIVLELLNAMPDKEKEMRYIDYKYKQETFNSACLSLLTITQRTSANCFESSRHSIWPGCMGLAYMEVIACLILIVFL